MRKQNMYYDDLIIGIIAKAVISKVIKNGFQEYKVDRKQIKPTLRQQVYC
jgi:hypothetical protein